MTSITALLLARFKLYVHRLRLAAACFVHRLPIHRGASTRLQPPLLIKQKRAKSSRGMTENRLSPKYPAHSHSLLTHPSSVLTLRLRYSASTAVTKYFGRIRPPRRLNISLEGQFISSLSFLSDKSSPSSHSGPFIRIFSVETRDNFL